MKDKTLQQWLDEMDKLDREASKGPWVHDGVAIYSGEANSKWIEGSDDCGFNKDEDRDFTCVVRTELPSAVRVIKYLYAQLMEAVDDILVEQWCGDAEHEKALQIIRKHHLKEIEKILNEEVRLGNESYTKVTSGAVTT